jgi:hypothetical protein
MNTNVSDVARRWKTKQQQKNFQFLLFFNCLEFSMKRDQIFSSPHLVNCITAHAFSALLKERKKVYFQAQVDEN